MTSKSGGFKNIKLGKNIHRQMKRRGPPQLPPAPRRPAKVTPKPHP